MEKLTEPDILILGAGYTLSRLADSIGKNRVVLTSTTESKVEAFKGKGWHAQPFRMGDSSSTREILLRYPNIGTIIDGTPPLECEEKNGRWVLNPRFEDHVTTVSSSGDDFKIIFLSTSGVTGVDNGDWVDETTPCTPKHERGWARLLTERLYLNSFKHVCCMRLPAIYGPGRGILNSLMSGRYTLIEDRERWTNRIHVEDLVRCLECALVTQLPKVLYVTDGQPALQREVVKFYCDKFNLPLPTGLKWEDVKDRLHHTQRSNQRISNGLLAGLGLFSLKYPSYREGAFSEQTSF